MAKIIEKESSYYKKAMENLKIPVCEQITALTTFLKATNKKLNQTERELIELTLKSASYVRKTIDMIDEIYKTENKTFKLNYENFDILALIEDILSDISIVLKCEMVNVELTKKEHIIINADKNRIKTALESILLAILNYVEKDSTISIDFEKTKDRFKIELSAKGRALTDEEIDTMFDKNKIAQSCFFASGLNFSMYLVKLITSQHFGQLILKSKNSINTFGFVIPM